MSTGLVALRTTAGGAALPLRSISQRHGGRRGIFIDSRGSGTEVVSRGSCGGIKSSNLLLANSLRRFGVGDMRPVVVYKTAARAAADSSSSADTSVVGDEAQAGNIIPEGTPEGTPFKRFHGAKLMMEDSVFAELELKEASQKVAGVRVRQHVNPLKASLQVQAPAPQWSEVYASVSRPLVVDIGCGGGRFDLMMAKRYPEKNFLGVDIRAPLVERGNAWGSHAGVVDNLHFAECNATVSMGKWLTSYADVYAGGDDTAVELVTIQFPDPHFKKRHHKRRVVQSALVRAIAEGLTPGARVFLQSDVQEVSEDMRDKFERFGAHLFTLDADLHDVTTVDANLLTANENASVQAAAAAFEEDERARVNREAAEAAGYPGRSRQPGKSGQESLEQQRRSKGEGDRDGDVMNEGENMGNANTGGGVKEEDELEWRSAWATAGPLGCDGWLDENPLGVPTEREVQTTSTGGRCYRVMLVRNDTPV